MRPTLTHAPFSGRTLFILAIVVVFPVAVHGQDRASRQEPADDPFSRRGWHIELGGHGGLETWNYNVSHEEIAAIVPGFTYGLGKGVVFKIGSPLYRVWQRGTDAYLFGVTWGVRSRIVRRPRWSLFWEFEVGVSESDTYVPPGGTRFNYLVLGGGGAVIRLRPGVHALAGLRWMHVSNNSLAGRSRNPDIEAVGPMLGVLLGF